MGDFFLDVPKAFCKEPTEKQYLSQSQILTKELDFEH